MPTDKKKVFLIVTESFDIGGLETRIKVEVIAMLKAGHKVHLACGENFNESLLPKGLTSVTSHLKLSAQATSLDLLASVNLIRNIITKNSVDYLIAHPFSSLLPSVMAAQLENIPCAITLHGPLSVGEMFGPIYEFIFFSIIIPSSSLIIAVSDEVKDLVTPHLGDRPVYVSPNTIDFNEFSPSPNELASNDGRWILVSRLDEAKITGIFDFIKKAKMAGISKIVVVGDGTAKPSLQEMLETNNLTNFVDFTGFRTDVHILMQNVYGVAGMGRVALEGMASKKAVCLVGYDGVKGFVDNDLFEAAKYSNFSGRNLSIVNEKLFNTQYKKINQQNINLIYNKSKLENSSIEQVANLTNQFINIMPIKGGMLSDIYAYLKSDLIPNNIPILTSNVFFEKIGRLIFSKQYFNADLSSNYTFYQKKLDDLTKDNVAYYFRAQVEQKLSGIQSELQGSAEKIGGLISKQKNQEDFEQAWQAKSAEDQAVQIENQEKLQTKLEILSDELAAAQQNKIEQIQIAAKREREHQQVISHLQTETLHREQAWQTKSAEDQAIQIENQEKLQTKLEILSDELASAAQNKVELIQIAAKREREHQQAISNLQAEILLSERAWQAKSSEVHALQIAMQTENLQREQIWQTKSDNLQLNYNEVQASLQNEINNLQHKIILIEQKNYEQKLENAHQFYVTKDWQDLAINIKNENDVLLKSKFWKFTAPFRLFSMTSSKLNELSYAIDNYSLKQSTPSLDSDLILNQDEFANLSNSDSNNTTKLTLNSRETMNNIQDLLALYGEDFLNESYRILLGRKADSQGLKHYLSMLSIGTSKLEMLLQLSRSKEAKKYKANFPGLANALSRHKLSKLPFCFWLTPNYEKIDNKLRMLENKLHELDNKNTTYSPSLNIESDKDKQNQINYLNQIISERENELSIIKNNNSLDLTWEQFEAQVLAFRDDFKGIFVQELVIDWNVPLYQRPQHIASAFGRLGYLVIYKTANWGSGDNINGVRQVAHNVWMTSCWDANNISNAVHSIYSTAYFHQPDDIPNKVKDGVVIYEYIDHIDPQISGEGETIEKLVKLQEWAFAGGVDFVVASAKKLHAEAVNSVGANKVILAQNGVDTRHYRNPIHDSTALPDNLMAFINKYQNVVGYFGAIAPWLWYKAIDGLVKSRPDLGFIFIGPDYFGGVDKLPVAENVLYLGVVDYKILPAYAKQFDVCFIPFEPGEIAKTTSPLKLFEYFALEKPVVVTADMSECVAFKEVFSGNSVSNLSKAIDQAIALKEDVAFKKRLAQLADENDWDERAKAMESVFFDIAINKKVLNTIAPTENIKPVTLYEDIEKRFGVTQDFAKLYFNKQNYSASEFDTWDSLSEKLNSLQNMYINFAMTTFNRGLKVANTLDNDSLIKNKSRYLDVGTGYGGFPRAFSSIGFKEVVGIELQQHLADYSKANTIDIGGATILNWDFEQSDTSQLEKFDLITCNDVIEHVKNPALTIDKMLGLLNKDGCISMEIPNDNCILYVKSDGHFQLFGITQLSREDAADYYAEMLNIDRTCYLFEMGESHDLDWYINKLTKTGGKVKLFDKHKIAELDQAPALINELKVTYEDWRKSNKPKLTANTFHKVEIATNNYINMIQKDFKAIKSKSSKENFIKKYLHAFWTLALSK